MPTISECEKCKRKGGYASEANAKVCARCEEANDSPENNNDDNTQT